MEEAQSYVVEQGFEVLDEVRCESGDDEVYVVGSEKGRSVRR